jgi:MoxR-like ATPase
MANKTSLLKKKAKSRPGDVEMVKLVEQFQKDVFQDISKRVKGNINIIEGLLTAILSQGHVILIGVPGLGKTLLVKCLASLLQLDFSRIQFTPDLMPSDITGSEIIEETTRGSRKFKFIKGPVFANVILADEINRTPPRTQSALLQAMEEKQVNVRGGNYALDLPFFVLATQNPIEQEGTYPLPEAQLDRFLFSLKLDYPNIDEEKEIAILDTSLNNKSLKSVLSKKALLEFQGLVKRVPFSDKLLEKVVALVRNTRPNPESGSEYIRYGAGPRASQAIVQASKAKALLEGSFAVDDSHVRKVAKDVLRHRIILNYQALAEGFDPDDILDELI